MNTKKCECGHEKIDHVDKPKQGIACHESWGCLCPEYREVLTALDVVDNYVDTRTNPLESLSIKTRSGRVDQYRNNSSDKLWYKDLLDRYSISIEKFEELVKSYPRSTSIMLDIEAMGADWFVYGSLAHANKVLADAQEAIDVAEKIHDNVNHPAHYTHYKGLEIIDLTEQMNFNRGNAVKYITRAGIKSKESEVQDLEKAAWYINREIKRVKNESL